jgi:hypothetical protein
MPVVETWQGLAKTFGVVITDSATLVTVDGLRL